MIDPDPIILTKAIVLGALLSTSIATVLAVASNVLLFYRNYTWEGIQDERFDVRIRRKARIIMSFVYREPDWWFFWTKLVPIVAAATALLCVLLTTLAVGFAVILT